MDVGVSQGITPCDLIKNNLVRCNDRDFSFRLILSYLILASDLIFLRLRDDSFSTVMIPL